MAYGMPRGMADLLAKKYAILQQQADAQTRNSQSGMIAAEANANLNRVQAGLLPGETAAEIGLRRAQAGQIGENTRWIAPLNRSAIALQSAQGQNYGANAAESLARAGAIGTEMRFNYGAGLPESAPFRPPSMPRGWTFSPEAPDPASRFQSAFGSSGMTEGWDDSGPFSVWRGR